MYIVVRHAREFIGIKISRRSITNTRFVLSYLFLPNSMAVTIILCVKNV